MNKYYDRAIENADYSKIDKLVKIIDDPETTKENYWDKVRKLTRTVTSCHSIDRWQCLSEYFYNYVN